MARGRGRCASEQLIPHCYVADDIAHDLTRRIIAELKAPTEQLFGEMLSVTLALHVFAALWPLSGRDGTKGAAIFAKGSARR